MNKRFKLMLLILLFSFCFNFLVFGAGDTNIDSGGGGDYENVGGGSGNGNGTVDTSILNSVKDEGVRVTLVKSDTGQQVTTPIDFANDIRKPVDRHFGKVSKLTYRKGTVLQVKIGSSYDVRKPDISLPKIVNGNLSTIKKYFGSEVFIRYLSDITGFNYNEMISGKYKLLIEPVGYPKIKGKVVACTATELAMYDEMLKGYIRSKLVSFSHRNLPLSMFLEEDDLGISAFKGNKNAPASNATIKAQLGIGIVSFKDPDDTAGDGAIPTLPNTSAYDYIYRRNTEVITSIEVGGGQSDPDQKVNVSFDILGKRYNVNNVYFPSGQKQLS